MFGLNLRAKHKTQKNQYRNRGVFCELVSGMTVAKDTKQVQDNNVIGE